MLTFSPSCDGVPRAHGSASYALVNTTDVDSLTSTITSYPSNTAMPQCSIDYSSDSLRSLDSASNTNPGAITPTEPACQLSTYSTTTSICNATTLDFGVGQYNPKCVIMGGPVQLAYFPVSVVGDLCGNRTTVTRNDTGISTAQIFGTVLTSPSVIVSFQTLYALDPCGKTIGTPISNFLLPQRVEQISTDCGRYHAGLGPVGSLNLADLNSPVAWSVYSCMPQCGGFGWPDFCSTIYDDFLPQLAFPTDVFNVDPAWATCNFELYGNLLFDPPTALQPEPALATPTMSQPIQKTTPASPSATTSIALQTSVQPSSATPKALPDSLGPSTKTIAVDTLTTSVHTDGVPLASPSVSSTHDPSVGGVVASFLVNGNSDSATALASQSNNAGAVLTSILAGGSTTAGTLDPAATILPVAESAQPANVIVTTGISDPAGPQQTAADPISAAPVTIGSVTMLASPGGNLVVDSATLSVGGLPGSIGDHAVSLASQGIVIDGTLQAFSTEARAVAETTKPAVIVATVGSRTLDVTYRGNLVLGSAIISPGGPAATISGQTISLGSQGIVVNGQSQTFPPDPQSAGLAPAAVVTIGSQAVTATSGNNVVVDSSTLKVGDPAVRISGQIVSIASNGVVVDGQTQTFSAATTTTPSVALVTLGSQTLQITQASTVVVGSSTLVVGGSAATINGEAISLASQGVLVDGISVPFTVAATAPTTSQGAVFRIGSQTYTALGALGTVTFDGVTLTPGQVATVSGSVISDASTGVVVGSSTYAFTSIAGAVQTNAVAKFTISGVAYTASMVPGSSGAAIVDGTTLSVGGSPVTINGQVVSEGLSGIIVGTSNYPFSTITDSASVAQQSNIEAIFTIGGSTHTATAVPGSSGLVAIDGTTLSVGGPAVTIDGQVVSEGSSGLVIGGTTTAAFSAVGSQQSNIDAIVTVGSSVYTATSVPGSNGVVVIDGTTLSIGGPVATINGRIVSEDSSGIVVGGTTTAAFSTIIHPSTPKTITGGAGALQTFNPWKAHVILALMVGYLI